MTSQKIVAIIQARMGSTRLPGKMLLPLAGKPVISHVLERTLRSTLMNELIVATTSEKIDFAIRDICTSSHIPVFAGSVNDVLDRYYHAAKKYKAVHVVRITGDCPLIDPVIIDKVIRAHLKNIADYTSNVSPPTYPDGLDVEVFTLKSLEYAWKHAKLLSEREHVTPYIKKHIELFKLENVKNDVDYSQLRWTLDNSEDYEFLQQLFMIFHNHSAPLSMYDIIRVIEKHPDITKINAHIQRNEGYVKSLKKDNKTI